MKYTSKEIQQILTSKTAIEGLDYITPVYHQAKTALWLMELMLLYSLKKVSVLERTAKNTFSVELYGEILEEQWQNIYQTIEKYKPAHLILEAKSILETPLPRKTLYVGGAVFRPIAETVLSEIEYPYQFHTTIFVGGTFQNIMETTLPELEFRTSAMMHLAADWCEIEQTILSEMKI